MKYQYAATNIETGQITSGAAAVSLDPNRARYTNRVLLKASAAGAYVGWGEGVTTGTGAEIPTTGYLDLWIKNPGSLYVVGGGATVYWIFEIPEGPTQ